MKMLALSEAIRKSLWFQSGKFSEEDRREMYAATDHIKKFVDNLSTTREFIKRK